MTELLQRFFINKNSFIYTLILSSYLFLNLVNEANLLPQQILSEKFIYILLFIKNNQSNQLYSKLLYLQLDSLMSQACMLECQLHWNYLSPVGLSHGQSNQYLGQHSSWSSNHHNPKQNMCLLPPQNVNSKIKTSLCKKWDQTGNCPYGYRCQFAHGIKELKCHVGENSYKTKQCHAFFKKGTCFFGKRCNFSHQIHQSILANQKINIRKKFGNVLAYHQIIQSGKSAVSQGSNLGSRLMEILKKNPEEGDQKSVSSTEESISQNVNSRKVNLPGHDIQYELSQQDNLYNYGSNTIYGNIAHQYLFTMCEVQQSRQRQTSSQQIIRQY